MTSTPAFNKAPEVSWLTEVKGSAELHDAVKLAEPISIKTHPPSLAWPGLARSLY